MVLEGFERTILSDFFAGARETLVLLAKKNGKTMLLAALALYHLWTTPDAECVVAAASREQAMILFDAAAGFIRRSPWLARKLKPQRGNRLIRNREDSGRIRVLAADVDTADGVRPTLALVDELHRHRSAALYGVFRDGLAPRDGRMITISTAGEHEGSPLGQLRAAARKLENRHREGAYLYARSPDGSFVMHEWSLEPGDDVDDMKVVKLANPASWWTVELLRERHDSPSMLPHQWARFACGLWVSSESWWMDPEQWKACASADRLQPGDRITLGFDGARVGDATALIACRISDGLVCPLPVPGAVVAGDGQPTGGGVSIWEDTGVKGWEVPGGEVDAAVAAAFERYRVVRMYADPPLWYTEIDQWAAEYGSPVQRFHTRRARMIDAVERFRTDVVARRVKHVSDPTLTQHMLNAQMREVRGGYWLAKPSASPEDKIDAGVAAVLAYEARADLLTATEETAPGRLLTF